MRRARGALLVALAGSLGVAASAGAQPRPAWTASPSASASSHAQASAPSSNGLRAHFGAGLAERLASSSDADDRLRALARATTAASPEGLDVLVRSLEPGGAARLDPRALIEAARGLSAYATEPAARTALAAIVSTPAQAPLVRGVPYASREGATARENARDDLDVPGRLELARRTAAIALAETGDPHAIESLVAIARSGNAGQPAALVGLTMHPPAQMTAFGTVALSTPSMLKLAADVSDLRTLDGVRPMAKVSDPVTRAAALRAMGELGDARAIEVANAAMADADPRVRIAAAYALVELGAPDRERTVEKLLADDTTAPFAFELAARLPSDAIVRALAARAQGADARTRSDAIVALGHQPSATAVRELLARAVDPRTAGDAADALARSPGAGAMAAIESLAQNPATRKLAARAYLVRALVRGEASNRLKSIVFQLARSPNVSEREVGALTAIAAAGAPLEPALSDPEPRVRRAAAMATLADAGREAWQRALLERLVIEKDEATRRVLAIGLAGGDADARVSTLELASRAESGGPDAPLAALALARRGDESVEPKVEALFASPNPIMRAHVARGLAASSYKDAVGRLARAYAYEPEATVRRAIVRSLAARVSDAGAPLRTATLRLAARLDPDPALRHAAARAIAGFPPPAPKKSPSEVAWLRLEPAAGATRPVGMTAALVRADGLAVPIAFDGDGFALLPGTPPGEARLVLAPRLPAYEAPAP